MNLAWHLFWPNCTRQLLTWEFQSLGRLDLEQRIGVLMLSQEMLLAVASKGI